jgi:hypothetical protein
VQAAALNDAVASIKQAGQIDTSGQQAGDVTILADQGTIKVDGSIIANSTDVANKGGNIIIGRDPVTAQLAKSTDVSGARLEAKQGFIETSGDYLKTDKVNVSAGEWLIDPNDITLSNAVRASAYKFQEVKIRLSLNSSLKAALNRFFLMLSLEGSFFRRLIAS